MPRRMIDTSVWSDARVMDLTTHAQVTYFRLILGDDTGPAGATRVTPKRIAVDTNMTRQEAEQALGELLACDLVRQYEGGWLWLPSFIKYQLAGPPFIRGIRRQAQETPEALSKAITRALDAIVGPDNKRHVQKHPTRKRVAEAPTEPAAEPTQNVATSRDDSKPNASLDQALSEPKARLREKYQYQDQDQDRPNGLSVLVPASTTTPEAAPPEPELGAQAPPRRRPPAQPGSPTAELVPLHQLMRDAPPTFLRTLVVTPGDA